MIGKIGTSKTLLDFKTANGKILTYYDGNKVEAKDSFVSIRANNCLMKGKWCYEVLLLSNGLFQIGFCQLRTLFTSSNGVGDDIHSFGYDGYRLSCWHEEENRFGKTWDYGDIIGICLDLERKQVEFYQNGKKLGIGVKNIETGMGRGIAYFPGASISCHEKCAFNFGAYPMIYNYPGYEPIDIPKSQYSGSFEVTSSLLQCLNQCNLLELLDDENVDIYFRKLINNKIFYFLVNISFRDFYLCKLLLFPFMYSLLKKNKGHYQIFLEQLHKNIYMNGINEQSFFSQFFEKLTNIIEEYGILGPKFFGQYEIFTSLFIEIINDDTYFKLWGKSTNFFGHLRNIFTSNTFHFGRVFDKINEIYGEDQKDEMIGDILKKVVIEGNLITKEMNEYDEKYFKILKIFIEKILEYYEKNSTLCQATFIFYDLMRACYPINTIKDYIYNLNTFMNAENKKNIIGFKNVIFTYMYYFFENYKNININEIPIGSATIVQLPNIKASIRNELSNSGIYVSYFREENIGGKSNKLLDIPLHEHTFSSSQIFSEVKKKPAIKFNILIRLISLADKFFFAYYELQSLIKDYLYEEYVPESNGTTLTNALFRYYFYLFDDTCQTILYNISFFLIKWMNNLILVKNKLNILLLPLYLMDFPFQIAQMMLIFKTKILYDEQYRKEINKNCDLFSNDDFLKSLIDLYITLFEDKTFTPYDTLIESLGWKIYLFLREEKSRKIIIKNEDYIKSIMKGVSNIMTKKYSERIILRILLMLHKAPNEKGLPKDKSFEEEKNNENIIKILQSQEFQTIFDSIISYFGKHLNTKLTTYCYDLDICKEQCIDKNFIGKEIKRYESALKSSYKGVCSVIQFYEFALSISSKSFFNQDNEISLSLIHLRNFLINLTSRILNQPYFSYIETMLNHIHTNGYELIELVDLAINFVLTCSKGGNKQLFIEFIVNTKEIFIHTLVDIYTYGCNIIIQKINNENNPNLQEKKINYEKYNEIIKELKEKRNNFEKENILKLDNEDNLYEDLYCIICYKQIADTLIKPCKHKGCKECLLTYMADNLKCFMCRQPIVSIQAIPKEELEKEKEKIRNKKKGFVDKEEDIKDSEENIKEEKINIKKDEPKYTEIHYNPDDDNKNFDDDW